VNSHGLFVGDHHAPGADQGLGAMAFRSAAGIGTLFSLGMAGFYATCLLFIFVVLGTIAAWTGFGIFKFIASSGGIAHCAQRRSESFFTNDGQARNLVARTVVGLIPTSYSFPDGSSVT
jgi:aerobic C4-dicarboxylate transport protein